MDLTAAEQVIPRLLVLPECGSTNAELRSRATDAEDWPHLSVLVTDTQTAGRGRLDRVWTAPAGTSLAISVLLRELPAPAVRGWLPLVAGVAMADAVAAQLPRHEVGVKWPNDVLVDGRKICGILAEAAGDAVIVGSGVNTAMTAEQLPVPTATSFGALGAIVDEGRLLADYVRALGESVTELTAGGAAQVRARVAAACLTIGQQVRVQLPGDRELRGEAIALDDDGQLVVQNTDRRHPVSAGDVVHVRPAVGR